MDSQLEEYRKHSLFTAGNLSVFPSQNLIVCLALINPFSSLSSLPSVFL